MTRKVYLLVCYDKTRIIPLLENALTVTQSSKKELNKSVGSVLIDSAGNQKRIVKVTRGALFGENTLQKLFSALFGGWDLELEMIDEQRYSVEQIHSVLLAFIDQEPEMFGESFLVEQDNLPELRVSISTSSSFHDLFRILGLSSSKDFLDVF